MISTKLWLTKGRCACGRELHYADPVQERMVMEIVNQLGPNVTVTVAKRSWAVQRHYVALHGIRAWELPTLGFPKAETPGGERQRLPRGGWVSPGEGIN